jgi:hypothetical protein
MERHIGHSNSRFNASIALRIADDRDESIYTCRKQQSMRSTLIFVIEMKISRHAID